MTFGHWSIDEACFNKILEILPKNKTILEFGSGYGSSQLAKFYTVYSVEHDKQWLKYDKVKYIFAPLIQYNEINWYDTDILKKAIPDKYDLIIIDGPPESTSPQKNGRLGFYYNLHLFNLDNTIIIFDDVERDIDFKHMQLVAKKLNKKYEVFDGNCVKKHKKFGIVSNKA